jgi:hypothetical protein
VVGHRRKPFSIRGVISEDDGATWNVDDTFTLHEWSDEPDMGYPVSVQLDNGDILTVFYCSRHGKPKLEGNPEGILFIKYSLN